MDRRARPCPPLPSKTGFETIAKSVLLNAVLVSELDTGNPEVSQSAAKRQWTVVSDQGPTQAKL